MPNDETQEVTEELKPGELEVKEDGTVDDTVTVHDAAPATGEGATAAADAPPDYVPNYKFKVLDEEKEFDEWLRPAVNKDNEAKVRELYEKAYGLDHVKPKLQEERQQREALQGKLEEVAGYFEKLNKLAENDLETFFEEIQMPIPKIAQWLLQKAEAQDKLKELPPHLQQVYTEHGTLKRRLSQLEQQNQEVSTAHADAGVKAMTLELNSVLGNPEITTLAEQFDARVGKPGAFREQVIRHGKAEWALHQRHLEPEEAVKQVIQSLGLKPQTQDPSQGTKPNGSAATPNTKVITQAKPTVIPNVKATPSAATSSKPRSVDDLRKLAKEALAAG